MRRTLTLVSMCAVGAAILANTGCAVSESCFGIGKSRSCKIESRLTQAGEKIDRLHAKLDARNADLDRYHNDMELTRAELARFRDFEGPNGTLPPGAAPGECFARIYVPPTFATVTEQVLKQDAFEELRTVPAQYEAVEKRVLVKEASSYLEPVPAEYKNVEETVLVRPARDEWREGRGLIEKVDNNTGEIMCRVHVPAEYKTVVKRVLVKPASVREVHVPAEYQTIEVMTLAAPARSERVTTPAEYQTITKTEQVADGRIEWRRVLCETNASTDVVSEIKVALQGAGHDPGPVDRGVDEQFLAAVESFQESMGLPVGGLTYETIERLGVRGY